MARSNAARVFSGAFELSPRCASISGIMLHRLSLLAGPAHEPIQPVSPCGSQVKSAESLTACVQHTADHRAGNRPWQGRAALLGETPGVGKFARPFAAWRSLQQPIEVFPRITSAAANSRLRHPAERQAVELSRSSVWRRRTTAWLIAPSRFAKASFTINQGGVIPHSRARAHRVA